MLFSFVIYSSLFSHTNTLQTHTYIIYINIYLYLSIYLSIYLCMYVYCVYIYPYTFIYIIFIYIYILFIIVFKNDLWTNHFVKKVRNTNEQQVELYNQKVKNYKVNFRKFISLLPVTSYFYVVIFSRPNIQLSVVNYFASSILDVWQGFEYASGRWCKMWFYSKFKWMPIYFSEMTHIIIVTRIPILAELDTVILCSLEFVSQILTM